MHAMLERARVISVRRDQILLATGLSSTDVYLVLEGQLRVSLIAIDGKESILRTIGPNEMFGEFAAIDGLPRSADITATRASRLAVLSAEEFAELLRTNFDVVWWLLQSLSSQMRNATSRIFELSTMNVASRIHCELLRLCQANDDGEGYVEIDNAPTHADLAARIGTSRELVTRELNQLAADGILSQHGRKITIHAIEQIGVRVSRSSRK